MSGCIKLLFSLTLFSADDETIARLRRELENLHLSFRLPIVVTFPFLYPLLSDQSADKFSNKCCINDACYVGF